MNRVAVGVILIGFWVLTGGAAAPPAGPTRVLPLYAEFGNWLVACDNTHRCEARGISSSMVEDLRIARASADSPITLSITTKGQALPGAIRIGGQPVALSAPAWTTRSNAEGVELSTTDPATVTAVLNRLRQGQGMVFRVGDRLLTDALGAVLAQMDQVQPHGAPPIEPPPRPPWRNTAALSAAEAEALTTAVHAHAAAVLAKGGDGDCSSLESDTAYALDPGHALVLLSCPINAYQGEALAFIAARHGGPITAFAPRLRAIGGLPSAWLGDTGFEPTTGTMTTVRRGRSQADCGLRADWVWSAGAFHLTALNYQKLCGGAPDDWATLFRSRD